MDHDLVIDKHMNIYVVFGSIHPPGRIYSYIKYVPSSEATHTPIWRYRGVFLERVVKRYSIKNVVDATEMYEIPLVYEPAYGVYIPYVSSNDIFEYLYPEIKIFEIYRRPRNLLEIRLVELIDDLRSILNIGLRNIGVSGSILGGFSSEVYSDIDLLIYGCDNASKIYENIDLILKPIRGTDYINYISNIASLHNIEIENSKELYRVYRRGVYKDKNVTIIFPSNPCKYPCRIMSQPITCVSARLYVPEKQCRALLYPGEVYVEKVIETSLGGYEYDIKKIILYEGIYSPLAYEGGILQVQGSLQRLYDLATQESYYVISVGSRECPYSIRRAK